MDAVLRLLKGEDLDTLPRELRLNATTLSSWREVFLANGLAGLKSRETDARDEKINQLQKALAETALNLEISKEINRVYERKHGPWHPGSRRSEVRRVGFPQSRGAAEPCVHDERRERGAIQAHTKGSSPPYLWPLLEIKYLCRMHSIEVVRLTDAHASDKGLYISRAKGSNDNIVKWTRRLRAAREAALTVRAQTLARPINLRRPIPIRPEQRSVFLSESGTPLTRAGLDNAWQDLIHAAMDAEVIAREQRFTLHGLKHRGITDTKGKRADKKEASGHKSEAMLDIYDHEVAIVDPARPGEAEAVTS